jgi:serine/threonine protein kinase
MQQAGDIITLAAGAYRLRERLAGSSYGVLWRADGPGVAGAVALKLVNREQMALAEAHQRAHWRDCAANEITFLRSLQPWDGRHIVRLVDSGEHGGLPAMALELLDGDLARHIAAVRNAGATVAPLQVLDWIAQVNQALAKVHQYGWRYLDLKPANLLLDARSGDIKLADFGTNRQLADLHPHSYAGSANWQAPEQFFPGAGARYETDARTDYFSLGALFYYLATGGQPLRYCSACGAARREHGGAAAALLLERHGGALPQVLQADEAALFVRRIGTHTGDAQAGRRAGAAALALLRALLCVERAERPPHALGISRALADIAAPLRAAAAVQLPCAA